MERTLKLIDEIFGKQTIPGNAMRHLVTDLYETLQDFTRNRTDIEHLASLTEHPQRSAAACKESMNTAFVSQKVRLVELVAKMAVNFGLAGQTEKVEALKNAFTADIAPLEF